MAGIIYYDYSQQEPLAMAAQCLGVDAEQLYSCPRFLYPSEEGVEEVRKLLNRLVTIDGNRVLYFADSDVLNVSCQNALLKTVEDRDDVLCIFVGTKKLLDTIESRCQIYRCKIPSRDEFYAELGINEGEMSWLYSFTKGHLDVARTVQSDARLCGIVSRLQKYQGPGSMEKDEIFRLFSMLREKDADCFFEKYKAFVPNMYVMLSTQLLKAIISASTKRRYELEHLLDMLTVHNRRVRASKSYSKNDFFDLLARM